MNIHLQLCDWCRASVLEFPSDHMVGGFVQLPPLCAECGGKVSQVVRLLLSGGVVRMADAQVSE